MTAIDKIARLPDWPARMTAPVAAAYMCVSTSSFITRFGDLGVKEGRNVLWARAQLDRLVARQFALPHPAVGDQPAERDESWDDVA